MFFNLVSNVHTSHAISVQTQLIFKIDLDIVVLVFAGYNWELRSQGFK